MYIVLTDDLDEINIPLTWSPCCIPRHEQEELVRTPINALCGDQTSDEKYNKKICFTTLMIKPCPGHTGPGTGGGYHLCVGFSLR